ncbi:TetR/AcrR family transcriptional regulator [Clostridiaceae bacterium M8S5]|nr:TetR/AcrR family transcriptional regulator [Clostridiaceae bacterium M8S5]
MSNKIIQRKRIMRYFIDAATEIIEMQGIENVTIRNVANLAGYNSATLYNYFDNLQHLISLACIKFLKDYVKALPEYISKANNTYEKTLMIWECFCVHTFTKPEIFASIFVHGKDKNISCYIKDYYEIYPEILDHMPEDLRKMLTYNDLYDRTLVLLNQCCKDGYFNENDLESITELSYFIYTGMLLDILSDQYNYTLEIATKKTMNYLKKIYDSYRIDK